MQHAEPKDLPELRERFELLRITGLSLRETLETQVVQWEYASYIRHPPRFEPFWFEITNIRRGRRLKSRKESMDAKEYGFDALGRKIIARGTPEPRWQRRESYYEFDGNHVIVSSYSFCPKDNYISPRSVACLDFSGDRLLRVLQYSREAWWQRRYSWEDDQVREAEQLQVSSIGAHSRKVDRYVYDAAGLARIVAYGENPHREHVLWLRRDLRPDPKAAQAALFPVLLPAIQRAIADTAKGEPVRRIALVCSDAGHAGTMPPFVFVGIGDVGSGHPNHWPFADLGIWRELQGPEIAEVCATFNLTDWEHPGRRTGQAAAELARRLAATGLDGGAIAAPDLVCFACTPEGRVWR